MSAYVAGSVRVPGVRAASTRSTHIRLTTLRILLEVRKSEADRASWGRRRGRLEAEAASFGARTPGVRT
eukprot:scaffold52841_cov36-Tisochrysis_lutea.AAC.2